MNQKTRTEYSVVNTSVAFIAQAAAILMGFFTRVVFTRMLSEGYVGIPISSISSPYLNWELEQRLHMLFMHLLLTVTQKNSRLLWECLEHSTE